MVICQLRKLSGSVKGLAGLRFARRRESMGKDHTFELIIHISSAAFFSSALSHICVNLEKSSNLSHLFFCEMDY